ncbi:MAG: family 20 glycosylhydrolase [Acidobacteria bacterium]|nr:family 20 glycosylhydrolase [Acidobacteriota bacterium]
MRYRAILFALFAVSLAAAPAVESPGAAPYPVWPIPREMKLEGSRLLLTNAAIVVPAGDARAQYPGRLLAEWVADEFGAVVPVVVGKAPAGVTPVYVGLSQAKEIAEAARRAGIEPEAQAESYALRIEDGGAVIAGHDYRGALYGVATFVQLVHLWGHRTVAVRKATVRDRPFLPLRWVHAYLPGNEMLPYAKRYLRDFLLRYKFNGMFLEVGGGMQLDSHPEINTGWRRMVAEWYSHGETVPNYNEGVPLGAANRFANSLHRSVGGGRWISKDAVRDFAALAEKYGLEIVPEIQSLSHVYYIAATHREVAEIPETPWPDAYCPSNPESYRILFDIMAEYIDVLKPKRVHIGHDEWRAGAFCPRCKGKDAGELFANDVLKIHRFLKQKGIETWMWGDHFVDWHNRLGRDWREGTVVRYELPDTSSARDIVARGAGREIHILNWSDERGDKTFRELGWPCMIGNFAGPVEKDWPGRAGRGGFLGGETSTWGAFDEFEMGKLNIPNALFGINLLWSAHYPPHDAAQEQVGLLLPVVRRHLAAKTSPAATANPMRFERLDITDAFNHEAKGDGWDLSGLTSGDGWYNGIPYRIGGAARKCLVVQRRGGHDKTAARLPVTGRWASLVFVQSATGAGRETVHAGDATFFPRESSELLGYYEIRYADGLTAAHQIRADETVDSWDAGFRKTHYFSRSIASGKLPDGRTAVLWASEWVNPRPDVPIVGVKMKGTAGPSPALPVLFAVTGVEKSKVEDY